MRCIVFANGAYGDIEIYRRIIQKQDLIICADGGANYAHALNLSPACIVGDLDSIYPEVRDDYLKRNVLIKQVSCRKDFTDTQLAIATAQEMGADDILLLGTLGKRLDHTLSNLYCGLEFVQNGMKITHFSDECYVHIVSHEIEFKGTRGDLVSILPLTEEASGVSTIGLEYSLQNAILQQKNPYAVSNVLTGEKGRIVVKDGLLAVFHYFNKI